MGNWYTGTQQLADWPELQDIHLMDDCKGTESSSRPSRTDPDHSQFKKWYPKRIMVYHKCPAQTNAKSLTFRHTHECVWPHSRTARWRWLSRLSPSNLKTRTRTTTTTTTITHVTWSLPVTQEWLREVATFTDCPTGCLGEPDAGALKSWKILTLAKSLQIPVSK